MKISDSIKIALLVGIFICGIISLNRLCSINRVVAGAEITFYNAQD